MKIILAVDKNFGIGKNNKLLFHIKKDLQHFKDITENSIVIMGRKTYESMSKALPKRENVVITRNKNYKLNDAKVFYDKEDVLDFVKNNSENEAFIIGGSEIVDLFLDDCDEAILTKVLETKDADSYLHNFDKDENFEIIEKSEVYEENDHKFYYVSYRRKKWKKNYLLQTPA